MFQDLKQAVKSKKVLKARRQPAAQTVMRAGFTSGVTGTRSLRWRVTKLANKLLKDIPATLAWSFKETMFEKPKSVRRLDTEAALDV